MDKLRRDRCYKHLVELGKLRRTGIKKNERYEYEAVAISSGLVN
jgi:hypothetical protein